jgi:hypothetical protein
MNLNFEILKINDTEYCGLVKNITLKINSDSSEIDVVSYGEEINLNNYLKKTDIYKEIRGNIMLLPVLNQYYHAIVDVCSKVLKLKNLNQNFTAVLYGNLYGENKMLMIYKSLLKHLNINYIVHEGRLDYVKLESTYIFFNKKTYHQRYNKFQVQDEIPIGIWLFDDYFSIQQFYGQNKSNNEMHTIDLYRKYFYDKNIKTNKKIYISRKDSKRREIVNEKYIEDFFVSRGYLSVTLSNLTFMEQIKLFNESSHIILQAGSSMVNQIFCHEGTKILEINTEKNFNPSEFVQHASYINIDLKQIMPFSKDGEEILNFILTNKSSYIKEFIL